jgi:hypothetical protein
MKAQPDIQNSSKNLELPWEDKTWMQIKATETVKEIEGERETVLRSPCVIS